MTEAGSSDTFTVVLTAQPLTDVVLSVVSADTGEATVSPATLTFTNADWNAPQTVTVGGIDDALDDGDRTTIITVSVVDADSDDAFDALADQTVSAITTDDDGVSNSELSIESVNLSSDTVFEGDVITIFGAFTSDLIGLSSFSGTAIWSDGEATDLIVNDELGTFSTVRLFLDDHPTATPSDEVTVEITIIDTLGQNDSKTSPILTVNNVDPSIETFESSADFENKARPGETVVVSGSFIDPGILDTHTAAINWGDGSTSSATINQNDGTFTADHDYATGGIFTITVTLIDDDTGVNFATTTAVVTGVGVNNGVLQIVGTSEDDLVTVNLSGHSDGHSDGGRDQHRNLQFKVHASFLTHGNSGGGGNGGWISFDASDITSILIVLCGGDDHATIAGNIDTPVIIDGGDGDDKLTGGQGDDILIGGDGNDVLDGRQGNDILLGNAGDDRLKGGDGDDILLGGDGADELHGENGRDILIGGLGADRLHGGNNEDILIGGQVDFGDHLLEALEAIREEWTTNDRDEAARRANISGTGSGDDFDDRLNGDFFLKTGESGEPDVTVLDDDAVDRVFGSTKKDWLFPEEEKSPPHLKQWFRRRS